ncbi:NADH-dependent flavin oxidoreductase [Staphylococcus massiliensis]|uniref:NADH-dependent flavin oxidoreductase n=1 Tax=Staphylococcus massiliensis TaxID=555791 RepID=UPI001EE03694|nr:NADH-dependent flavin oxidoreductase [Staphylococcus massiliensis]MCG3411715.1 NADH-dependent flavin oxidoreductase [Staphylococcus massiliensis]
MNPKYEPLFESFTLPNGVTLKNRFVLAPLTHVSSNDDGTLSDIEIPYIKGRSKDVGLTLTAASYININGKAFPGHPSASRDSDIEGLKEQARVMKENGAKALLQIHHGGARTIPKYTPNNESFAPSEVSDRGFGMPEEHESREMTVEEIEQSIKDYGEATRRAIEAGFDGVEIHGANHYLIHQFVSPHYNRREDAYGARFKYALDVIKEVVAVVKAHTDAPFIVGYRFSPEEAEAHGISMEITKDLLEELVATELDYLHVSLFDFHSKTRSGKYEGEERIKLIRDWVDGRKPLIGIGSIFSPDDALDALDTGIPLIALGRQLLLDKDFVGKLASGREDEIISKFDPEREDKHDLPPNLWQQFNEGFYPLPRTDEQ